MNEVVSSDAIEVLTQHYTEGRGLLRCMYQYLMHSDWTGTPEQLAEALPHFSTVFTTSDMKKTFANMDFSLKLIEIKQQAVDRRLLPVMLIADDDSVMVLKENEETGDIIKIDELGSVHIIEPGILMDGTVCIIRNKVVDNKKSSWTKRVFFTKRFQLTQLILQGLVANTLVLMTPFYIMAVYDGVVKTQSYQMLIEFLIGILLALSFFWFIQKRQKRLIASICADSIEKVDENILAQLLKLPANYTEVSSVPTQISRVQDYDKINEVFSTQILNSLVELPFILIFLGALYAMGGLLVLVPICAIAGFALLAILQYLLMKWFKKKEIGQDVNWRSFLIESIQKIQPIKYSHFERAWYKRFTEVTAKTIYERFGQSFQGQVIDALADALVMVAALSILGLGVVLVSNGLLTVGGLIASMIILWRIMSPVRKLFVNISQIKQFREMLQQIERLAGLNQEEYSNMGEKPIIAGKIDFHQVGLRYIADREPALMGATFTANPGELIVITGPNGSGKSTILKLLLRLYQPQVGSIMLDDQDIRQIPHNLVRKCVAYASQYPQFFYGTISQNMRLANPIASDTEIEDACNKAFVLDDIKQLPNGFNTRIRDNDIEQLPASFRQRLQLARTLLVKAPILLLDEPASHLDGNHDEKFIELLHHLHGKQTIIMSSHRPSHFRLADKVLFLQNGQIKKIEKPDNLNTKVQHV